MKVLREVKVILKIVLIILVVAGVIAGTAFLFFKFLKREENSYNVISSYVYSSERADLLAKIDQVKGEQTEPNKARFDTIITIDNTLNDIANNIVPNLKTAKVNNKKIVEKYKTVVAKENSYLQAISTFNNNIKDPAFKRDAGANDIMLNVNGYLASYADLLGYINMELATNLKTPNVDVALYINELYCKVVLDTIESCDTQNEIYNYASLDNLKVFDGFIANNNFKNYYVNTSIYANYFINEYNKIDHAAFAKKLSELFDAQEGEFGTAAGYLKQLISVGE